MSNYFKLCPTHFSKGENKIWGGLRPVTGLGQSCDPRDAWRKCAVRSFVCRQVAILASHLLYSWSSLCNNNMAINLQMFTSSYGSRRFSACDQDSHWGFFHPDLFFSRPVRLGLIMKNRAKRVFWSDKLIRNFTVLNNIKITLHYNVFMRTSGGKVRMSDEAERFKSFSYSHITVVPKLFLIAYHLWAPCCQHVPPCFRKSQCAKYNSIKSLENQNWHKCNMKKWLWESIMAIFRNQQGK